MSPWLIYDVHLFHKQGEVSPFPISSHFLYVSHFTFVCCCPVLLNHYLLTSCTLQLCCSKEQADRCTGSLHMARRISHFTHTYTNTHKRQKDWVHDWPHWNLGLNSFVDAWIKYADHMRLLLTLGHWFIYTHYRFQFISAKTNTSTRGWALVSDSQRLCACHHDRWLCCW